MSANANIAEFLRATATARPDDIGVVDGDLTRTWAELDREVDTLAAGLLQRGLHAGDRVALLSGNSLAFILSYFAILRAGLVAVPLNPAYTAPEVAVLLTDSGARLLLAGHPTWPVAQEALLACPGCEGIEIGGSAWQGLFAPGVVIAEAATGPDALALLVFTSGTSGRPKGAMLPHGALRTNVQMLRALDAPPAVTASDVTLAVLPLFHIYGLNTVLTLAVSAGSRVVVVDHFDPVQTLEVIQQHNVTTVAGAPGMYQAWCQVPQAREALAGVRLFSSGGAPLPPEVLADFGTKTGKDIFEGYGMTETSPVVSTTLVSGVPKPGSVGRPLPGVDIRITDDRGDEVEEHDPGELWVKGPTVFIGYWPTGAGGPDADGWFQSGDVAYLDADGDLHLVDRRREVILVNGFNVYPREIELTMEAMPQIAEVAVMGVADDQTGEAVIAIVVPRAGVGVGVPEIEEFCSERLARFKCPTVIRIVDELPHSATGKIAKGRLREVYGDA
jgi:long-chain acyl-CoA synthetase